MMNGKIRNRDSYRFWHNIVYSFSNPTEANKVCWVMWKSMDELWMFNTRKQSNWNKESLALALDDFIQQK